MAKDNETGIEEVHSSPSPATVFKLIVFGVVFVYALLFIFKNSKRVEIDFVFFTVYSRAWLGFIASLIIGAVLGLLGGWARRRGKD